MQVFSDGKPLPCILAENKADLLSSLEMNNAQDLTKFSNDNNFTGCFRTSAKTGLNIGESMDFLISNIINRLSRANEGMNPDKDSICIDPDKRALDDTIRARPHSGCC